MDYKDAQRAIDYMHGKKLFGPNRLIVERTRRKQYAKRRDAVTC